MNDENTKLFIENLPQIITALGTFVTAVITAIIGSIVLYRQGKNAKNADTKLDAIHEQVNGQSEALLEVTRAERFAAGQKDEKENPS